MEHHMSESTHSVQPEYTSIIAETSGRVATITLNRPEALNALSNTLIAELVDAAARFDQDPNVGAIVITGSERAFAAGADIKGMLELDYADVLAGGVFPSWGGFETMLTPTIAAVSGFALGGGCELAMMCDIIIAADNAKFGQPEINLGVIPGFGGSQRLPRAIGKYKAADMILTGRMMGAEEAERSGLVSRIVPAADLIAEATKVATTIASKSMPSVIAAKNTLQVAEESSLAEGLRYERAAFAALFATEDQTEGMTAFAEKREANFKHR